MFRFLKGIMKGGEEPAAPALLSVDELPAWIQGEEGKVREELASLAASHRPGITRAMAMLEEVLSGFDAAEMEDVSHRKLAHVTEKSLPLFLKAMRTSLSRELPGDPEAFYTATAEILKGCLSAFRGQGRYLASRFPSEMKALREGVDTMGREANAMTPGIARARERLRALGELRDALEAFSDSRRRAALAGEEARSLEGGIAGSRAALEPVQGALAELGRSTEFQACGQELARIRALEEERDGVARLSRGTASAAIHLMAKGEKIASRKKDREGARVLHEAIALLGGELPLPTDTAEGILGGGQQALASLAASGDLVPKNREETALLGEPGHLAREMQDLSRRFSSLSDGIASAREALGARPALARERELGKERDALEKQISRMEERLVRVKAEGTDLGTRECASFEDLQKRVNALSGGSVRVAEPGPAG
jgi:hypothetical protein